MFSLDEHAGNVVTTVALFVVVAATVYMARGAFLILLLSVFFAHLLDPAVNWLQRHSWPGRKNRNWAIAQVCLIGTLVLGTLGYKFGPSVAAQLKNLNAAVAEMLESPSSGNAAGTPGDRHGFGGTQARRLREVITRHRDLISRIFERSAASIAYVAASAVWLFAVPILAVFILLDGQQIAEAMIQASERRGNPGVARRVFERIDAMIANYIRAQFALAGLSFGFYSASMLVLRFPYAIALALLGGVLEFLPTVGWVASALIIVMVGLLTHSHWIWMAGLLVGWRLTLDYAISPHIMSKNLQLPPLTVMIALMVGGQVGGIAGVYLSVPVVAALRIVWLECFSAQNSIALRTREVAEVKT